MAETYSQDIESTADAAFGIIVGFIYSGFLQAYSNQQLTANLEDIQEFHKIMKEHTSSIKKAITGNSIEEKITDENPSKDKINLNE